jgi:PAS domain S-box-containing protein
MDTFPFISQGENLDQVHTRLGIKREAKRSQEYILAEPGNQPPQLASACCNELPAAKFGRPYHKEAAGVDLQKSDERFRALIENSSDLIAILDAKGIITYISSSVTRILGYEPAELEGKPFSGICRAIPGEGASSKRSQPCPGDYTQMEAVHKDGSVRVMEVISNNLLHNPVINGIVINAHDITERRKYELLLKKLSFDVSGETGNAFFHSLVKKLSDALDGDLVFVGELDNDHGSVKAFAFYGEGRTMGPMTYSLAGSPCEQTFKKEICIYSSGVQEFFPGDPELRQLGISGYAGRILRGVNGEPIGILVVMSRKPMNDTEIRRSLVNLYGARAAAELERLVSEKRSDVLRQIDKAILESRSIKEIADVALANISLFVRRFDRASVCIFDFAKEEVTYISSFLKYDSVVQEGSVVPISSLRNLATLKKGKPLLVKDIAMLKRPTAMEAVLLNEGLRSYAIYPIISKGQLTGALGIGSKEPHFYKAQDFSSISEITNQLALAIHDLNRDTALRQSEMKNKALLNAIPDIMFHFDSKGVFRGYKGDTSQLFNESSLFMGKKLRDVYPKAFADECMQCIQKAIVTREVQLMEYEMQEGGSESIEYFEARFIAVAGDDVLCLVRDITQRKRTEYALKESQRTYSTLVSNLPGMVYRCSNDRHWTMHFVSEGAYALTGYTSTDLVNGSTSYHSIIHPEDRKGVWQQVQQALKERKAFTLNYRIITAGSSIKWVWEQGSGIYSDSGKLKMIEGFITDITAQKESEELLQEKNHEMNNFVYKASHDLKGPLASIIGVTNLALKEVKDEHALKFAKFVNESTSRLDSILEELLEISRVTHGSVNVSRVDVSKLAGEIIESLQHAEHSRRVKFEMQINGRKHVHTDRKILTSVVQNLVDNAIKYKNNRQPEPFVHIIVNDYKHGLMIEVRDNGVGIPDKLQGKVFDMFFRGSERSKGTGLGLYIVKNSLKKLGGLVDFYSREMEGSSFNIYLPDLKNKKNLSPQRYESKKAGA